MSYSGLVMIFCGAAAVVALMVRHRTGGAGPSGAAIAWTLVALVLATVVFDNLMIGAGLINYGQRYLAGVFIGRVPVEDLGYPLAGALLLPALWHLLGAPAAVRPGRRSRHDETGDRVPSRATARDAEGTR